jgi:hypothetical protein
MPLTVSIGATIAPASGQSKTEILSLRDLALCDAKAAGRNRTAVRLSHRGQATGYWLFAPFWESGLRSPFSWSTLEKTPCVTASSQFCCSPRRWLRV